MTRLIGAALAALMALAPLAARADQASGHAALALAALVGSYSPSLNAARRATLAAYLSGHPGAHAGVAHITVAAAKVTCGAGDVDITRFFCDLTFGHATKHLTGRAANELFATLGEAGVEDDGAAGTIYHGITSLHCTLTPALIAQNGGGGAECDYQPA